MLERIEIFIRRLRNYSSRSGLLIKLFGLSKSDDDVFSKGLVMIQIDALSQKELERAIDDGKLPFIKSLLNKEHYRSYTHYSGMPCSTAAVQAELFYGVKSAVPSFTFYDHKSGRVLTMFNPRDALEVEERLQKQGKPLLAGGSSYSNIYTGGAEESHFCISNLGMSGIFKNKYPVGFIVLAVSHFFSVIRIIFLLFIEAGLAVIDFFKGLIKGRDLWKELKFVPSRVAICVLLRELIVIGAKIDIARGMPVIHLNLMGYHEQSHRRGPESGFARWTLRGIDDAVRKIWLAAHRSDVREYDVLIYSDHGQIETIPYEKKFGKSIQKAISDTFDHLEFSFKKDQKSKRIGFLARAGLRKAQFFNRLFPSFTNHKPIITALGPVAHVYMKGKLEPEHIPEIATRLIDQAHVPIVIFPEKNDQSIKLKVWTEDGHFTLPEQADRIFDKSAPYFYEAVEDLLNMCRADNCGDILVGGLTDKSKKSYSFAIENGSHGGMTTDEMEGFVLLPKKIMITPKATYLRPTDIRKIALSLIKGHDNRIHKKPARTSNDKKTIRIMTYNVHGCVGMDGKLSPRRIAEVIDQYQPDIVALQELDVGRLRSGEKDQAMLIADYLNMKHHFNPSMQVAEEMFGDAILSPHPVQLIKKGPLIKEHKFKFLETRGALWAKVKVNSSSIHIINTHLGLYHKERLLHSRELLGSGWLTHPDCEEPKILCGDFNTMPGSKVFKLFNDDFASVQVKANHMEFKRTWCGLHPIVCVDHIFISPDIEVDNVEVGDSYLARLASDHRPLIADLKIKEPVHHGI